MQSPHENPSVETDASGMTDGGRNAPISHVRSLVWVVLGSLYGEGPPSELARAHQIAEEGLSSEALAGVKGGAGVDLVSMV